MSARYGPLTLAELYADPLVQREEQYGLRPYTGPGLVSLEYAPPKAGKSTFASYYAKAKALGLTFIGQEVEPGFVLYVPPDEGHRRSARRFREMGLPVDTPLEVWAGTPTIEEIAACANVNDAALVVVDTLSKVARWEDENSNSEVEAWFAQAVPLIRNTNAEWLFSHHDRKSGGPHGSGIRGASAIYGNVDIAFSLERDEGNRNRRILKMVGTRFEDVDPVVIELTEDSYDLVGDTRRMELLADEKAKRIIGVLDATSATVREVEDRLDASGRGVPHATVDRLLRKLASAGLAVRQGAGGHGDPFRYSRGMSPIKGYEHSDNTA